MIKRYRIELYQNFRDGSRKKNLAGDRNDINRMRRVTAQSEQAKILSLYSALKRKWKQYLACEAEALLAMQKINLAVKPQNADEADLMPALYDERDFEYARKEQLAFLITRFNRFDRCRQIITYTQNTYKHLENELDNKARVFNKINSYPSKSLAYIWVLKDTQKALNNIRGIAPCVVNKPLTADCERKRYVRRVNSFAEYTIKAEKRGRLKVDDLT